MRINPSIEHHPSYFSQARYIDKPCLGIGNASSRLEESSIQSNQGSQSLPILYELLHSLCQLLERFQQLHPQPSPRQNPPAKEFFTPPPIEKTPIDGPSPRIERKMRKEIVKTPVTIPSPTQPEQRLPISPQPAQPVSSPKRDLHSLVGDKSIEMKNSLRRKKLNCFNENCTRFTHQGTTFEVLTSKPRDLSKTPIVSIGSSPFGREMIVLDPNHSPILDEHYQHLVQLLEEEKVQGSNKNTFSRIMHYVNTEVFDPNKTHDDKALSDFIASWKGNHDKQAFVQAPDGKTAPVIPLDDFIKEKVGICRHQSLVMTYLLQRLSLEHPEIMGKGTVHHIREKLPQGSHAWVLFVAENGTEAWHLDPTWNLLAPLHTTAGSLYLRKYYGKEAITNERNRFLSN